MSLERETKIVVSEFTCDGTFEFRSPSSMIYHSLHLCIAFILLLVRWASALGSTCTGTSSPVLHFKTFVERKTLPSWWISDLARLARTHGTSWKSVEPHLETNERDLDHIDLRPRLSILCPFISFCVALGDSHSCTSMPLSTFRPHHSYLPAFHDETICRKYESISRVLNHLQKNTWRCSST